MPTPTRNLLACGRCRRQYDVGDLAFGECLRCLCGETLRWLERSAHSPTRRCCPHCGGSLPAESRACSYCSAEVQLDDRGLAEVCPACFARLLTGARFCMECGIAIQPQQLHALPIELACPRCRGRLRRRELGGADVIECGACAGLWIAHGTLDRLVADAQRTGFDAASLATPEVADSPPAPAQGYIPCVSCEQLMLRRNFGQASGVVIDVCGRHGVWFDHRELERALQFVRGGGLRRAQERELARREERLRRLDNATLAPSAGTLELGETGSARSSDLLEVLEGCGHWLGALLRRG